MFLTFFTREVQLEKEGGDTEGDLSTWSSFQFFYLTAGRVDEGRERVEEGRMIMTRAYHRYQLKLIETVAHREEGAWLIRFAFFSFGSSFPTPILPVLSWTRNYKNGWREEKSVISTISFVWMSLYLRQINVVLHGKRWRKGISYVQRTWDQNRGPGIRSWFEWRWVRQRPLRQVIWYGGFF